MARIKNGILGGFSGRIGPVVGASYNGKDYMRSQPDSRKRNRKEQDPAQARFRLAGKLMSSLQAVLKVTYRHNNADNWTRAKYISLFMKSCIVGEHPNYTIDYPKVPIGKGRLPVVSGARIVQEDDQLIFSWVPNGQNGSARCLDKVVLISHKPEGLITRFEITGAKRNDGTATLNISKWWVGVHETYLVFLSEDEKDSSPGVYIGRISIE